MFARREDDEKNKITEDVDLYVTSGITGIISLKKFVKREFRILKTSAKLFANPDAFPATFIEKPKYLAEVIPFLTSRVYERDSKLIWEAGSMFIGMGTL
jgi:hypothetical protein